MQTTIASTMKMQFQNFNFLIFSRADHHHHHQYDDRPHSMENHETDSGFSKSDDSHDPGNKPEDLVIDKKSSPDSVGEEKIDTSPSTSAESGESTGDGKIFHLNLTRDQSLDDS